MRTASLGLSLIFLATMACKTASSPQAGVKDLGVPVTDASGSYSRLFFSKGDVVCLLRCSKPGYDALRADVQNNPSNAKESLAKFQSQCEVEGSTTTAGLDQVVGASSTFAKAVKNNSTLFHLGNAQNSSFLALVAKMKGVTNVACKPTGDEDIVEVGGGSDITEIGGGNNGGGAPPLPVEKKVTTVSCYAGRLASRYLDQQACAYQSNEGSWGSSWSNSNTSLSIPSNEGLSDLKTLADRAIPHYCQNLGSSASSVIDGKLSQFTCDFTYSTGATESRTASELGATDTCTIGKPAPSLKKTLQCKMPIKRTDYCQSALNVWCANASTVVDAEISYRGAEDAGKVFINGQADNFCAGGAIFYQTGEVSYGSEIRSFSHMSTNNCQRSAISCYTLQCEQN